MLGAARTTVLAVLALVLAATLPVAARRQPDGPLHERLEGAYARGIRFLAAQQLDSGEFPMLRWTGPGGPAAGQAVRAIFTVPQVLHSLRFADGGPAERAMRRRALDFLLAQQEPPGIWRYYGRGSDIFPDVDDTATAWVALLDDGRPVDPAALDLLLANRWDDSGLFATWMGDRAAWMQADPRGPDTNVNVNALFLLARLGRAAPEVCRHAVDVARTGAFARGTLWYPSPLAFTYFLSRAHADGGAACLGDGIAAAREHARARQAADGGWGDDLDTALGVLTLLNSGVRDAAVARGLDALLARQEPDGGWRIAPHYTEGNQPPVYFGSRALTTALCLEAVGKALARPPR